MLAHASCQAESVELPVTMVGSRAVATVGINGTQVPLTVDSGAFFSMLTDAAAARLKLSLTRNSALRVQGITGRVDAQTAIVDKLQLLKGEFERIEFVVGGNAPGAGTSGLMGRNILSLADTEYDLAHGTIRFMFPNDDCSRTNMAYWAGSSPVTEIDLLVDSRTTVPSIRARAKLNGTNVVAMFDTGATTLVSRRAAARAGVSEADLKPAGTLYGAGSGNAESWTAPFDRFEIGGEAILHNRLRVANVDMKEDFDMLLGIDFFLSHRIYVSKKQSKIFFTYNGGTVFALDRTDNAETAASDSDPAAAAEQAATADQFARRGAASAARHDYESALADLNRACELEPTSPAFFTQRGEIQAALKRPGKAMEDFDRAIELAPTHADARFGRASLRAAGMDRDGAKADLNTLDQSLSPQAEMRLAMSRVYMGMELQAEAIAQMDHWLSTHPNEATRDNVLNSRCWARAKLGVELDRALADCNEAIDSQPKNPNYLDSRGWVYLRMGDYKKALSDFDRGLGYRPDGAWSLYGRGLTKTRVGDVVQGEADLAAARKLRPDIDLQVTRAGLTADPVH